MKACLSPVKLSMVFLLLAGGCGGRNELTSADPMSPTGDPAPATGPSDGLADAPVEEAARRLARLLWQSTPDQGLRDALTSRAPLTAGGVAEVARTMLKDPRAAAGVGAFYTWWLNLDDLTPAADLSVDQVASMRAETAAFGSYVTLQDNGRFETLLEAPYTFMNEELGFLYGIPGITGSALHKTALNPEQRTGILGLVGPIVAASGSARPWPTHRSRLLVERVVSCEPLPAATEAELDLKVPSDRSARNSLVEATSSSTCMGCHTMLNMPGFGFEHFDGMGRFRMSDGGEPVDASGLLPATMVSAEKTFTDQPGLARAVAETDEARRCFTQQWFWYAFDRTRERIDTAPVEELNRAFAASDYNIRDLIVALVSQPAFFAE